MEAQKNIKSNRARFAGKRNLVLIARYYYWTELARRRFDDVLSILSSDEFFIGERTITNALNDYTDFLNELLRMKAGPSDLRKMFPSWNWEVTPPKTNTNPTIGKYLSN